MQVKKHTQLVVTELDDTRLSHQYSNVVLRSPASAVGQGGQGTGMLIIAEATTLETLDSYPHLLQHSCG